MEKLKPITPTSPQDFLSAEEIKAWDVFERPASPREQKALLASAVAKHQLDNPFQVAGQHFVIGCVALEITQRCNLDCTACYLSDYSEAVHDLPLDEVFRRIDLIADYYGPNTNVQVTGGDPTLRKRDELVAIIARLAEKQLRPALFTNGIKATREMLSELKEAGLKDVAFHVDMTQERKGFESEMALNAIRDEYIERARGLGLQVIFNTTLYQGNLAEIPSLVDYFCGRADQIHLASFQMIADTGRGIERERGGAITQDVVMDAIREGVGVEMAFDFPQIGHLECNRYSKVLVAGDNRVAAFTGRDRPFYARLMPFAAKLFLDRHKPIRSLLSFAKHMLNGNLSLLAAMFAYGGRKAWALRSGLWQGKGQVDMISLYVHNFMHAEQLSKERCDTCVFMTMTRDGPVSMCVHNAKRDSFILQDVTTKDGQQWNPLGKTHQLPVEELPTKRLKGRERAARDAVRVGGRIGEIASKREKAQSTPVV
ncbi:MAG: radical SAM protein [Hyphomicrobiales bacterium]